MHKGFAQAALTLWLCLLVIGGVGLYFRPLFDHELVRLIPAAANGWARTTAIGAVGLATIRLTLIVADIIERRRHNPFQFLRSEAKEADASKKRSVASFLVTLFTGLFGIAMYFVLGAIAGLFLPLLETIYDKGRAELAADVGLIITLVLLMGIVGNGLERRFLGGSRQNK